MNLDLPRVTQTVAGQAPPDTGRIAYGSSSETARDEMIEKDEQQLLGVATDGLLLRRVAEATKASKAARETLASERQRH